MQLLQLFGTPCLTQYVARCLFSAILKHFFQFSKQLLIPPSGKLQRLRFIYVTNNGAL